MKIPRLISWLFLIVAALIALLLWHAKNGSVRESSTNAMETNIIGGRPSSDANSNTNAAKANLPPTKTGTAQQPPKKAKERMSDILSTYNDVPIAFYGRLEDQTGSPVAGAQIRGSIRVISGARQTTDWLTTTSDANGLFELHGRGQDISMMPSKEGYALASTNGFGDYSFLGPEAERPHPDPNNPVIIKMWKLQGGEPLTSIDCKFRFHFTNSPIHFDLITGQIVPSGGDIKITVNRMPGIISVRNQIDWNVEIEAVDGGLIDPAGSERTTYFAPESGYVTSEIIHSTDRLPEGGLGGFRKSLYLKARNGQIYGKLGLSFGINLKPDDLISIRFNGIANTNGSRNWEGDPNTFKGLGQ